MKIHIDIAVDQQGHQALESLSAFLCYNNGVDWCTMIEVSVPAVYVLTNFNLDLFIVILK